MLKLQDDGASLMARLQAQIQAQAVTLPDYRSDVWGSFDGSFIYDLTPDFAVPSTTPYEVPEMPTAISMKALLKTSAAASAIAPHVKQAEPDGWPSGWYGAIDAGYSYIEDVLPVRPTGADFAKLGGNRAGRQQYRRK